MSDILPTSSQSAVTPTAATAFAVAPGVSAPVAISLSSTFTAEDAAIAVAAPPVADIAAGALAGAASGNSVGGAISRAVAIAVPPSRELRQVR